MHKLKYASSYIINPQTGNTALVKLFSTGHDFIYTPTFIYFVHGNYPLCNNIYKNVMTFNSSNGHGYYSKRSEFPGRTAISSSMYKIKLLSLCIICREENGTNWYFHTLIHEYNKDLFEYYYIYVFYINFIKVHFIFFMQ